ncbi:hypothetical protein IMZ31_18935 (plasmid) [Pontibacillus sp. ALD_SL1]|uniref:hypothetical protein n=1 Tax=Pontibacillus sp. ALD_SL1 TaxID=2777185 RepID=UPI001A966C0B|nr:hypothetical protein [Pontibacillus sp. ALD_SL1]QST02625.1 hypothetical protein IMZ31_18935 [Pontibacillus sp. ALD_SL1]
MSEVVHHAILVSVDDLPNGDVLWKVHKKAQSLFDTLVSEVVHSNMNHVDSFFIAPDGSYDGREMSNRFDEKRDEFISYLESFASNNGSSPVQYAEIRYDEMQRTNLIRSNQEIVVER